MHIHISPLFRRRPSRAGGAACDYRPRSAASPLHSAHFHPPNKSLRLRRNNVSAAASPISSRLFADRPSVRPSCSSSSLKPSDESVRYLFFYLSAQFHCLLLPSFHTRTEFKLSSLLLHLMLFVLHLKKKILLLLHFTSRSELLQGAKHQGAAAGSCYTKSCRRLRGVEVGVGGGHPDFSARLPTGVTCGALLLSIFQNFKLCCLWLPEAPGLYRQPAVAFGDGRSDASAAGF